MSDTDGIEKLKTIFKNGVALKIAFHIESNRDVKGGLLDTFSDALYHSGYCADKQEDTLKWASNFLDCVSNGVNVQDLVNRCDDCDDCDDSDKKMRDYLQAIVDTGKKHGFCLSHQDGHGGFEVVERSNKRLYEPDIDEWLLSASLAED